VTDVWRRITDAFAEALAQIVAYLPRVIGAVVIVLIGYLIGLLAKTALTFIINRLLEKPLEKTKVGKMLTSAGISLSNLIGSLVMAMIIAVSIVAAVDVLAIPGYTGELISSIARYIVNITAGVTILAIGIPLALIAAEFLSSLLFSAFKEKYELGSTLVYDIVSIVLSVFVIALSVNVMFGYRELLDYIIASAPGFIAASIILLLGYIIGKAIGSIVSRIVDNVLAKPLETTDIGKVIKETNIDIPGIIGGLIQAFIIIVAIVAAVDMLKLGGLIGVLTYNTAWYLPKLVGGIAILTLGLILSIVLARYIGKFIKIMFKERYAKLGDIAENLILLGLITVVVTIALNLLELQGGFVYPLILGVLVIVAGVFIAETISQLMKETHPAYEKMIPFLEALIILIFVIVGVSAMFSQFTNINTIVNTLTIGLSIAFAIVLIPIAIHYARLAWREVESESK